MIGIALLLSGIFFALVGIHIQLGRIADCQESRRIVEKGEK